MSDHRRTLDIRTRIVHSSHFEKLGHYHYDEITTCGLNTSVERRSLEFFGKPEDTPVTCMACLGEASDG